MVQYYVYMLLIIWYSKFSIEMLQSGAQILRALRLDDQYILRAEVWYRVRTPIVLNIDLVFEAVAATQPFLSRFLAVFEPQSSS
jgi:hypothetical protein